jgi:hypothetical protein
MNYLNQDFAPQLSQSSKAVTAEDMRSFYLSSLKETETSSNGSLRRRSAQPSGEIKGGIGPTEPGLGHGKAGILGTLFWNTAVLSERTIKNYSRNLLAYGVRSGMYAGMGLMLAYVKLILAGPKNSIEDFPLQDNLDSLGKSGLHYK